MGYPHMWVCVAAGLTGHHAACSSQPVSVQRKETYKDTASPAAPLRGLRRVVVVDFHLCQPVERTHLSFTLLDDLLDQVSIILQNGIATRLPIRNCSVRSVNSRLQLFKETHLCRHT